MKQENRMEDTRLLNVNDVADMLGASVKMVCGWVYEGIIPHVKPTARCLRFRRSDIDTWLDNRTRHPRETS